MDFRGQTTIELTLLLAVSMLALLLIFSLYMEQVELANFSKDSAMAEGTIQRVIGAANSLYFNGTGSSTKVFVQIPESVLSDDSNISGRALFLRVARNSDIIGTSDVNFVGSWKRNSAGLVKGSYYATLFFDGNNVLMYYDDFDLTQQSFYFSTAQGSSVVDSFNVRNNSSSNATFWVSKSFSHSDANLSLYSGDDFFSLSPNEVHSVDFNLSLSSSAYGNYPGKIVVVGRVNQGIDDLNISKDVFVSAESFLPAGNLILFPKTTAYSASSPSSSSKAFQLCTTSSSDVNGISWSKAGNGSDNNNASTWFSVSSLETTVSAYDCYDFNLTISVPSGASLGLHDANITASKDSNSATAFLIITVS